MTINLLLLDDHPLILDGLAAYLGKEEDLVVLASCSTTTAALEAIKAAPPDVAVLDIKLQDGNAFSFVADARAVAPNLKIVFITGHDDDVLVERAYQEGALGYVLKSEPLSEITFAVRMAARGERHLSPQLVQRFPGLAQGLAEGSRAPLATRLAALTKREREVLHHVSQGRSAKEISDILKISTWTVTNHKANIMAKLDIHNQVGLARFALSTGLATNF